MGMEQPDVPAPTGIKREIVAGRAVIAAITGSPKNRLYIAAFARMSGASPTLPSPSGTKAVSRLAL
jgi:hypothetical protein